MEIVKIESLVLDNAIAKLSQLPYKEVVDIIQSIYKSVNAIKQKELSDIKN